MKTFKEVLSEGTKYYRGHSKGADPMRANKKGIIWVTPSEELAATYGEEVSEVSFNPRRHKIANLGEINKVGTVRTFLTLSNRRAKRHKNSMMMRCTILVVGNKE